MIKGIQKSKLNIVIDIILLVLLVLMAGFGFLIKYVLLPGTQRNSKYGSNIDLEFLGMDRHQWGNIHLIISIIFIALIILHIILHWDMILCILDKMIPRKTVRNLLLATLTIFTITLFISPFLVSPVQVNHENNFRNRTERLERAGREAITQKKVIIETQTPLKEKIEVSTHDKAKEEYDVHGTQTIDEVSAQYNVPANYICKELKVSENNKYQRLGRLRKEYGFSMSEVSNAIAKYKNSQTTQ